MTDNPPKWREPVFLLDDIPCNPPEIQAAAYQLAWDREIVHDGFTRGQLTDAFDKVKDKTNWKNPIDAVIPVDDIDITESAVTFFTGSLLDSMDNDDGTARVIADGYYNSIGA